MFVVRGQAKATNAHSKYCGGSIHSLVAVGNCTSADDLMVKTEADLRSLGFGEVRFLEFASVPIWRAILPTRQGKILRAGLRSVAITIFNEDDGNWSRPDA